MLAQAFVIDEQGIVTKAKATSLVFNYESRTKRMMEQHGIYGRRVPSGLRALPSVWSEVLQPGKLLIPEAFREIHLFGPDTSRLNRDTSATTQHHMHGYMILRQVIQDVAAIQLIAMPIEHWHRLLDHRGWNALWGDVRDKDEGKKAQTEHIQSVFLAAVKRRFTPPPRAWDEVVYNSRVYKAIEVPTPTASGQGATPALGQGERPRKANQKPPRATTRTLAEIPAEDWDRLLWEILEINHQGEMRAMQLVMTSALDSDLAVLDAFRGLGRFPAVELQRLAATWPFNIDEPNHLAATTADERRTGIVRLLGTMKLWNVVGRPFLNDQLRHYVKMVDDMVAPGSVDVDGVEVQEVNVLLAWSRMFIEKFGRAPTAPRLSPIRE